MNPEGPRLLVRATADFLLVIFDFKGRVLPDDDELEAAFNKAVDWLRYAPNCWIIWTTSEPTKWYARLKPHIEDADDMLICKVDLRKGNRAGWLPKSVWKWIDEHLSPK